MVVEADMDTLVQPLEIEYALSSLDLEEIDRTVLIQRLELLREEREPHGRSQVDQHHPDLCSVPLVGQVHARFDGVVDLDLRGIICNSEVELVRALLSDDLPGEVLLQEDLVHHDPRSHG